MAWRFRTEQPMPKEITHWILAERALDELDENLLEISRSSIAALDELWTISSSGGDQVALIDTI